jgi:acyl carrier protein
MSIYSKRLLTSSKSFVNQAFDGKSFVMKQSFSTVPKSAFLPEAMVADRVILAAKKVKFAPENIQASSHLMFDLNFDSFLRKKFVENVSEEFCVPIDSVVADSMVTVQDAIYYISTHPKAR